MIDEIVELILKEARGRKVKSLADNIFVVETEIEVELVRIRHNLRDEERRLIDDKNNQSVRV